MKKRKLSSWELHSAGVIDLKKAIDSGRPCLISMYGGWNYPAVYRYSKKHIFAMDPSLNPDSMVAFGVQSRRANRAGFEIGGVDRHAPEKVAGAIQGLADLSTRAFVRPSRHDFANVLEM